MKQLLLIVVVFFMSQLTMYAQESCEVKLKDIRGEYTGGCEKGD